ncbi:fumarylacetoacetate hydrolase family protein [Membranihabitans marinus]|uniref:fumarylacetoacetate hydrolase family protein n=1 Tax=Membranihabitans marinus TaxID=1227546 RepID=UPI001F01DABC|nr:fumarylacetoacetate hydrolase family protein [Membranihabitans marinus]
MKIYNTKEEGIIVFFKDQYYSLKEYGWDDLVNQVHLRAKVKLILDDRLPLVNFDISKLTLLPPIGQQEVWASGVTYLRSKNARMAESQSKEGGDFYDKVYVAERPELFFKSTAARVVGPLGEVNIRPDSTWDVPEPELTLFITSEGSIEGYTAGNDMSSRSIEGQNPLYLPQAKMYEKSAALGPCLYVPKESVFKANTQIRLKISRGGEVCFDESIGIDQMKRNEVELKDYLMYGYTFPVGVYLMTGTGIVPPDSFTLAAGDVVSISIDGIGELVNTVAVLQK